ncbi:glycosyltransferase family 61 protein [Roseococcus sp. SYP-B2431]|uniref:glycosyltransferase family 61 protein n=1 Tax=Roseococcus sp. SYP-B2431 TaxID=2496640 RepID=UPI00103D7F34|nr:glycosyltransferase 61 family protein [Roseococcus sp. SYP-B2431]TCH96991.1 glycosyltransferase family 61 protein [Roseococcus sp. SYP-B2431]
MDVPGDLPLTDPAVVQVLRAAEYSEICERVDAEELLEPGDLYYVACAPYALPLRAPAIYTRGRPPKPLRQARMPEMHIAKLHRPLVCRGQVLVHSDGASLLVDSFRRGARRNNSLVDLGPNLYGSPKALRPEQVLAGRHFYLDGRHGQHFGHFLTEVLPRLWAAEFLDLAGMRLLMNAQHFAPWMMDYLQPLGFGIERLTLFRRPVECEELVIARQGCVLGRYFHPLAQGMARRIAEFHGDPAEDSPRRFYISRRGVEQRGLVNEERIEEIAGRAGFTPIRPETLPVPEQIRLFAAATHVVGPIGSGGYNALFALRNPRKLVLRPASLTQPVDMTLNAAIGGEVAYVDGMSLDESVSAMTGAWHLDPELFAEALADWLSRD